ncbi:C40 family peptidase [Brevibacterium rongguiense]|uniref:C40 family peptidase n=1 Tax=Brevibacterium rongguiense TaxID=2695267 RepID=UPI002E2A187D|nr:C40 family peptidase [Brevibacterium rongguiense]
MPDSQQHGRRAAATRVKTPLTELTESLSASSGTVGRRAAVVAAAGGLLASASLPSMLGEHGGDAVVASESQPAGAADYEAQAATKVDSTPAKAEKSQAATSTSLVTAAKAPKPKPAPAKASSSSAPQASAQHSTAEQDRKSSTKKSSKSSSSKSSGKSSKKSSKDAPVPSGSKVQQVMALAKSGLGTPYVSGGTSPSGWDCSGFTSYVYKKVGVHLPRTSGGQAGAGKAVSKSNAKAGDLIVSPGHVGIYAGNGMMYDAGNPRVDTSKRSIDWMVSAGASFRRVL